MRTSLCAALLALAAQPGLASGLLAFASGFLEIDPLWLQVPHHYREQPREPLNAAVLTPAPTYTYPRPAL